MFARFMKNRRYPAPRGPGTIERLARDLLAQAASLGAHVPSPSSIQEEAKEHCPQQQLPNESTNNNNPSTVHDEHEYWAYLSLPPMLARDRGEHDPALVFSFSRDVFHFGAVNRFDAKGQPPVQCFHIPLVMLATVQFFGPITGSGQYRLRLTFVCQQSVQSTDSPFQRFNLFMDQETQERMLANLLSASLLYGRPWRTRDTGLNVALKPCWEHVQLHRALAVLDRVSGVQKEKKRVKKKVRWADLQPDA